MVCSVPFCHVNLCNSWRSRVQRESGHKLPSIRFTVASVHIEATAERKPSMADLSTAWLVQPDFVKLDYPWIGNTSDNVTPPLIPHIIHQVCHNFTALCSLSKIYQILNIMDQLTHSG